MSNNGQKFGVRSCCNQASPSTCFIILSVATLASPLPRSRLQTLYVQGSQGHEAFLEFRTRLANACAFSTAVLPGLRRKRSLSLSRDLTVSAQDPVGIQLPSRGSACCKEEELLMAFDRMYGGIGSTGMKQMCSLQI